jgi:hypothetical protein
MADPEERPERAEAILAMFESIPDLDLWPAYPAAGFDPRWET